MLKRNKNIKRKIWIFFERKSINGWKNKGKFEIVTVPTSLIRSNFIIIVKLVTNQWGTWDSNEPSNENDGVT